VTQQTAYSHAIALFPKHRYIACGYRYSQHVTQSTTYCQYRYKSTDFSLLRFSDVQDQSLSRSYDATEVYTSTCIMSADFGRGRDVHLDVNSNTLLQMVL